MHKLTALARPTDSIGIFKRQVERQYAIRHEPRLHALQALEAADHETCDYEERQRQRDLGNDEQVARSVFVAGAAAVTMQQMTTPAAGCIKGGCDSEQHCGEQCQFVNLLQERLAARQRFIHDDDPEILPVEFPVPSHIAGHWELDW